LVFGREKDFWEWDEFLEKLRTNSEIKMNK